MQFYMHLTIFTTKSSLANCAYVSLCDFLLSLCFVSFLYCCLLLLLWCWGMFWARLDINCFFIPTYLLHIPIFKKYTSSDYSCILNINSVTSSVTYFFYNVVFQFRSLKLWTYLSVCRINITIHRIDWC